MVIRTAIRSPIRSVTGLTVAGQFDESATLDAATAYLGGIAPLHWFDFVNDEAVFSSVFRGNLANTPGWSFTRASVGTAETVAGAIVQFPSGELRRTDRGVLLEGARTNLFLNSETGATQSITVAAVAHVLSMRGTGTITLTGVSTAGPLVGTGANDTVTLAFTPTAGTLTLTVAGSCTNVQLEDGAFRSSWIPTAGASVTRNADSLIITSPGITYPASLWAEVTRLSDSGAGESILQLDENTNDESVRIAISSADLATAIMVDGAVQQAFPTVAGSMAIDTVYKIAGRFNTNSVQVCRSGTLGTEDVVGTLPATPTHLRFGLRASSQPFYGYIKRAAIFNSALSDANLQTVAP